MRVVVTGAAGFIGAATAARLLDAGHTVTGIDSLNDYYPVALKQARLATLTGRPGFAFHRTDLADTGAAIATIVAARPDLIVHLAAQAGVRASATRPFDYVRSNLVGHVAVLEATRQLPDLQQLVYASSSSVYGNRADGAFCETDRVDTPRSLYAATKRADELMTEVYAGTDGLRATGLRFFTVYGPMGRPDMAYWTFADQMLKGEPVTAYAGGQLKRDFTYVDDVVAGILAVCAAPPPAGMHRIYNIGNNHPETVAALIAALEQALGVRARVLDGPKPDYDVVATYANVDAMRADFGWAPTTPLVEGIARFGAWFKDWSARS